MSGDARRQALAGPALKPVLSPRHHEEPLPDRGGSPQPKPQQHSPNLTEPHLASHVLLAAFFGSAAAPDMSQ